MIEYLKPAKKKWNWKLLAFSMDLEAANHGNLSAGPKLHLEPKWQRMGPTWGQPMSNRKFSTDSTNNAYTFQR